MALPLINDEWSGVDTEAMKVDYLARVERGERLDMRRQANYRYKPRSYYEAQLTDEREYVDASYFINSEAVPCEVFEAVVQACHERTQEGNGGWQWRIEES